MHANSALLSPPDQLTGLQADASPAGQAAFPAKAEPRWARRRILRKAASNLGLGLIGAITGSVTAQTPRLPPNQQGLHRSGPYQVRSGDLRLEEGRHLRGVDLRIHEPVHAQPVALSSTSVVTVIITPDLLGRRRDGESWARHWASWGLRVIHLQHQDSESGLGSELDAPITPQDLPEQTRAEASSPMALLRRLQDIQTVVTAFGQNTRDLTNPANPPLMRPNRQNLAADAAPQSWVLVGLGYGASPTLAMAGMRLASAPTTVLRNSTLRAALLMEPQLPSWALPHEQPSRGSAMSNLVEPFTSIRIPTQLLSTQSATRSRPTSSGMQLEPLDPRWLSQAGEQHRHILLTDLKPDHLIRPGSEPKGLNPQGLSSWQHALQRSTEFLLSLA